MEYETTFEGKPLKRVDSSITQGKKTQATVEAKDYGFGKIPDSEHITCIYNDTVYVVLKTDKEVHCTCPYFRENPGQICEHILGLQITKDEDFEEAPHDIIALLEETEGWTINAKGLFAPPSEPFTPETVAALPPLDEDHDAPVDPPAKKPLCVATCQYCELEIKAATQENADKRRDNHEKVCKERPAEFSKAEAPKQTKKEPAKKPKPTPKEPEAPVEPPREKQPTPPAVKTYTCKICGTPYPTSNEALNCIESHQELQEIEETRALVDTTGKTSDQMWSDAQIEVMKKTVAIGATPAEFAYFLNVAKYSGLNPFLREIYFIKTEKGQVSIITARDGYLTIAKRDQRFMGIQSMEVCEKDTFTINTAMDDSGDLAQVVQHQITNFIDRGPIIGAWARGQMRGEEPVIIFTSMSEYDKSKQPKGGKMWKQYPSSMIRKVAEAMVLKRIAGISGLVTDAEMNTDVQILDAEVI